MPLEALRFLGYTKAASVLAWEIVVVRPGIVHSSECAGNLGSGTTYPGVDARNLLQVCRLRVAVGPIQGVDERLALGEIEVCLRLMLRGLSLDHERCLRGPRFPRRIRDGILGRREKRL